jgi:hypothetical protein
MFQAIEEFKKGKVEYRVDKTGIVHIPFGKVDFSEEDLITNFMAVVVRSLFLQTLISDGLLRNVVDIHLAMPIDSALLRGTSHQVLRVYTGKRHTCAHLWDLQSS